jgi:hypothetical protein
MQDDKKQLTAVHERDLATLLKKFGIWDQFDKGGLHCKFCKEVVAKDNVYSVLPEAGMVNLICDKPDCITQLIAYLGEKHKTKTEQ